jgi:ABC-type polysaccharide/polyol phosphate transport system ATPase subunit
MGIEDNETILTVDGLSKLYRTGSKIKREIWAVNDVSFSVRRGQIFGVIGPNGAGKTTLLKVIGRVTRPTKGTVRGRGRVVPLLALGAGFQGDLSGRENIFMNAAMYGIDASDVEMRLDEIVEFAGLRDFLDVPVKRYSSGMYLRLAFSVAINMRPDILLADEVLAVGDLEFQERCLERVRQAGDEGMAVLFVSHDMEAIRRLCDTVLWLNAGEIEAIGPADEITSKYENASWSTAAAQRRVKGTSGAVNAMGEIVSARLTVNGREIGAARVSDEVTVTIGVRIKADDLVVRPIVDVKARGVLAFRSVAPDWVPTTAGMYMASVVIPAHLLADSVYSVDVIVGIRRGEERFPVMLNNALSFPVYDNDEQQSARGSFSGQIRGLVRPKLAWNVAPDARGGH